MNILNVADGQMHSSFSSLLKFTACGKVNGPLLAAMLLLAGLLQGGTASALPMPSAPAKSEFSLSSSFAQSADYSEALALLEKNRFDEVVALGKNYVSQKPMDAKAHLILMLGWTGQGDRQAIGQHFGELDKQLPKIAAAIRINLAKYHASEMNYQQALEYLGQVRMQEYLPMALRVKGAIYSEQGDTGKAIAVYRSLLDQVANDQTALLNLANLLLIEKQYAQSQQYAQRLIEHVPGSVPGLVILGTDQLLQNRPREAAESFGKAVALDAGNPVALLNLGCAYHASARYDDARVAYGKFAQAFPKAWEGHAGLALMSLDAGMSSQAKAAAEQALALNPRAPVPHLVMAAVALAADDSESAQRAYANAGELYIDFQRNGFDPVAYLQPKPAAAAVLLANANFFDQQGYTALAIGVLEKASEAGMQTPFIGITKARALWKTGQPEQARAILAGISHDFPELLTPILENADIAYFSGAPRETLQGYQQVMQQAPELAHMHLNLGNLYNALGEPAKAVKEYEAYLARGPRTAYVLNQLAATLSERQNLPARALPFALEAQKIDSESLSVKDTLGDIYYRLGKYENALRLYREIATASATVDPQVYYRMGLASLELKDEAKAAEYLRRALNTGRDFAQRSDAEKRLAQIGRQ